MFQESTLRLSDFAQILKGTLIGNDCIIDCLYFYPDEAPDEESNRLAIIVFQNEVDAKIKNTFKKWIKQTKPHALLISNGHVSSLGIEIQNGILVPNVLDAMTEFAALWRQQYQFPIVAITGSCGKTTTTQMLGKIVKQRMDAFVTPYTINSGIGIVRLIFYFQENFEIGVLEIAAHDPGDIAVMTKLLTPRMGIITNINASHIETLGNLDNIAYEKAALFRGLTTNGTAIINNDDHYADYFISQAKLSNAKIITYGIEKSADVTAKDIILDPDVHPIFKLVIHNDCIEIKLNVIGKHHVYNALAASAAAHQLGFSLSEIKTGLNKMSLAHRRLDRYKIQNATILDDSFNSSWGSVQAAIKTLGEHPKPRVLVIGDFNYFDKEAEFYHKQAGLLAKEAGIDIVYGIGEDTCATIETFGSGGLQITDKDALLAHLKKAVAKKATILFKGRYQGYENPMFRLITKFKKMF